MGIKKLSENLVSMILLISGVALRVNAQTIQIGNTIGKGSDFMPKLCTTLWIIIAAGLLLESVTMKDDGEKKPGVSFVGFALTVLLLVLYIFLMPLLGFMLSSILYMFAQMLLFVPAVYRTKRNVILFAGLSVAVPIAVYYLFVNVFYLLLPAGKLF